MLRFGPCCRMMAEVKCLILFHRRRKVSVDLLSPSVSEEEEKRREGLLRLLEEYLVSCALGRYSKVSKFCLSSGSSSEVAVVRRGSFFRSFLVDGFFDLANICSVDFIARHLGDVVDSVICTGLCESAKSSVRSDGGGKLKSFLEDASKGGFETFGICSWNVLVSSKRDSFSLSRNFLFDLSECDIPVRLRGIEGMEEIVEIERIAWIPIDDSLVPEEDGSFLCPVFRSGSLSFSFESFSVSAEYDSRSRSSRVFVESDYRVSLKNSGDFLVVSFPRFSSFEVNRLYRSFVDSEKEGRNRDVVRSRGDVS